MKVGILTFHWANHFGAVLQAWALNKLLTDMGYEAEIMNYLPNLRLIHSRVVKPCELTRKYRAMGCSLVKGAYSAAREAVSYIFKFNTEVRKNRSFNYFRKYFTKISPSAINNISELKHECLKYDVCLVGSDQVWNPEFLQYSDFAYLLPFQLKETRKIAFSASIAVDVNSIPLAMLKLYRVTLSDFSFISLREKTHLSILSSLIGRKIYHTLDPTLLVDKESFNAIMARDVSIPYDKYVLVYNLGFSMLPLTKKVIDILKLPAIIYIKRPLLSITQKLTFSKYFKNAPSFSSGSPREFLTLLRNAEFVITNSFHGTALSILFEKPFMVILADSAIKVKTRILDLLELFELRRRLFAPGKKLLKIICEPIDYDHVTELLSNARRNSLELLRIALRCQDKA